MLPEEELVGRLQSGQIDVGFFYSTETAASHIPAVKLPPAVTPRATYTITILKGAPHPKAAEAFTAFLLSPRGKAVLKKYGLDTVPPKVSGKTGDMPAALHKRLSKAK